MTSSSGASSLPPVITNYFEQLAFGKNYYHNKQALAVSYLMAIGAKCLILEEINDSTDSSSCILHEESNLWHKLLSDRLRLRIATDGLWVQKKARNGRLRTLLITLKTNNKNDHFEWNSNGFFGPKSFLLKTLRKCTSVVVENKSDESPQHRLLRTNSERKGKEDEGSMVSTTYVSLVNDVRRLDLRLENDEITVIFVDFINHTYL